MSRQELSSCVKQNYISFSWHVTERIRERRLSRQEIVNCLRYGLLRSEEDGKVVCSHQRIKCAIAKNSIGVVICSAWKY